MRVWKVTSIVLGMILFGGAIASRASGADQLTGRMNLHIGSSPSIALPFSMLNAGPGTVLIKSIPDTTSKEFFIIVGSHEQAPEAIGSLLEHRFRTELSTANGPIYIHPEDARIIGGTLAQQLRGNATEVQLQPIQDCAALETLLNTTENAYYSEEQVTRMLSAICEETVL